MTRTTRLVATLAAAAALSLTACSNSATDDTVAAGGGPAGGSTDAMSQLIDGLDDAGACPSTLTPDEVAANSTYAKKASRVTEYADMRYCYIDRKSEWSATVYTFSSTE